MFLISHILNIKKGGGGNMMLNKIDWDEFWDVVYKIMFG